MDPIDKCKSRIRAAIDDLERETGLPVLTAQMVVLTAGASPTYYDDPKGVGRTIAVGLLVSGRLKRVQPWLDEPFDTE